MTPFGGISGARVALRSSTLRGFLVATLSVAACDAAPTSRNNGPDLGPGPHPMGPAQQEQDLVDGAQADATCLANPPRDLAPVQAEAPLYQRRRQPDGQLLPINAACIAKAYRAQTLQRWADEGDPVAQIGLAYLKLGASDASCRARLSIADALRASGTHQEAEAQSRHDREIRVPEAFALAAAIYLHCHEPRLSAAMAEKAHRYGYAYLTPIE